MKKIIMLILSALLLVMAGCEDEKRVQNDIQDDISTPEENQTLAQLSDIESRLADLAGILPEALTDPELAGIVYAEAKRNEADEPYALWREIADKPTSGGVTLRSKVRDVLMKRTRGKTRADAMSFTAELDGTDHLQVYVHNFEGWSGASTIPATFTPLTVNDVDVGELTLYDSLGNASALDVTAFYDSSETSGSGKMRMIPTYAIAIVGINESAAMAAATGSGSGNTGGSTNTQQVKITEIKLHKNAWWYEPWWLGKAELYTIIHGNNAPKNSAWGAGFWAPVDDHVGYKCWKWNKRWWGGYYKQDKPWRNFEINTGWTPDEILSYENEVVLRIVEYDPYIHDGGGNWIDDIVVGTLATATVMTMSGYFMVTLAGIYITLNYYFNTNDDLVSENKDFKEIIEKASKNHGIPFEFGNNDFRIRLVIK
ncbi:hypothetical protein JYT44_03635 [Caldithrix abyssi]|nr:hypothetical protein [Caldithrix abyssi]